MQTLFIAPGACSFGSIVALELLAQPYQVGITTPEIRAGKEFRAINPLGKVGSFKDSDNLIYENAAILMYLVDKNPNSKISLNFNSKERIEAYKWLSYLSSTLHTAFGPIFQPKAFVDDEAAIEKLKQKTVERIKAILAHLDEHLARHKYFIGDTLSIIDGQAYGLIRWANKFDLLKDYPAVSKFMAHMGQLPSVQNALNIEQQKADKLVDSKFTGYYKFA